MPTLPISAYYFHTINLNGFLANLVAVPLATFLLYAAMLCLILPFLLSQYLAWIPEVTEK
ncbi:MAG: ComEC/Rec2 family competence protein [Odoribacter splanchnicus]